METHRLAMTQRGVETLPLAKNRKGAVDLLAYLNQRDTKSPLIVTGLRSEVTPLAIQTAVLIAQLFRGPTPVSPSPRA